MQKRNKMQGLPSILSLFRNEFKKFNNTRTQMLYSIDHMMLKLIKNHIFWRETPWPTLKNVGLACSYLPTQNKPYPKSFIDFLNLFFFSNSVNNLLFKIIKSCILIEERLQRLLLYMHSYLIYSIHNLQK